MSENDAETFAYLVRDAHGCVVGVTVDDPKHARDTAKFVADCVRQAAVPA